MNKKSEIFGKFIMKNLRDRLLGKMDIYIDKKYTNPESRYYQKRIKELNFTDEQIELMFDLAGNLLDRSIGNFIYHLGKHEDDIDKVISKEIIDELFEGVDNPRIRGRQWREKFAEFPHFFKP
jgi:hypothetical protein